MEITIRTTNLLTTTFCTSVCSIPSKTRYLEMYVKYLRKHLNYLNENIKSIQKKQSKLCQRIRFADQIDEIDEESGRD